ncbi:anillin isoform X7 [Girardinichthys multiradiatus]|uniref:anillin isoform X7 n=1 Tax=Girardinichthys multiradiatus TaxID=208333 RepID=UPI001FAC99D3|nr:anillin isoform X7 [Girardinichthys multiradiatus]
MEAEEENGSNITLKRQREPLSDTEDNVVSAAGIKDGLKRRRLEAAGQENQSPELASSRLLAEFQPKPDTPIIPSVRSRVQLLTQRNDGLRSLSDPGNEGPSVPNRGVREHLLGEEEFNQRMDRFKTPVSQANATQTPSPASTCPRTRSGFVCGIQQKLQCTTTPSSKQASIIRQERELELNQLPFQSVIENAWLKWCSSDSSINQGRHPVGSSSPSRVPVSKRKFCWPPLQPQNQVPGDAEMKDGSFTEILTSVAKTPSGNLMGYGAPSDATGVSTELRLTSEGQKESISHDAGSECHDDTNTAETIEKMFEEVLEYAEKVEEEGRVEEDGEDHDSGIACSGGKNSVDLEREKNETEEEPREEECDEDELLTFPQSGILSPLSKSVEAVVTPLRLAAAQESNPPSLLLTPQETSTLSPESAPLYSIDAYRTQRQSKLPTIQSVTPAVQRRAPEPKAPVNIIKRITALNEEAGKLQTVINQTLQALSCCTDEEHGRGSLEEAEAEKLLLVSCEKRSALLAEVARLREERNLQSEEAAKEDTDYVSQQACRGTVSITNIQLPLKVEFVCSSHNRAGRPSHYFFVLIRYGPCNIIATPLATAADAQNGDTISFPTAVTLKDIRSSFEIDVEVYSLCPTSGTSCSSDRTSTKSRVTPRKLLNTITKSSNVFTCAAPAALNTRRSSNFSLVGSHKITLASLGCSKFPLDKMKLDGKIRRLLGDEFQEKVPFLSPLEGHIYLKLDSEGHSDVQHQGFLTMFTLISGFGVWNRRYFVLEECNMYYWNNPNDRETKEAEGSISLPRSPSQCVRPVKRDSCARPFTFELANASQQDDQNQEAPSKCWFSADTKQERLDWMEKLNQALLDFHTWNCPRAENQASSSGNLRESIL